MSRNTEDEDLAWAIAFILVGCVFFTIIFIFFSQSEQKPKRHSLTCYNSAFEISYMSPPNAVIGSRPNQYGVWTLEDGAYVQNSGETCIVEEAQVEVQK